MPLVDVIVPVYNTAARYVRPALASALAQTAGDLRVIVVNDGSTPECSAQLEALIDELGDARLLYVDSPNRGPSGARNLGISRGDSPFVALLDSDDLWYPDKTERQLGHFRAHPEADLVWGCADLVYGDDMSSLERVPLVDRGVNDLPADRACVAMLRRNYIDIATVMFRRESVARVGGFDEAARTIEDKDLWFRMLVDGQRLIHFPEALAIYRVHAASASRDPDRMRDGRLRLIGKVDALRGKGIAWVEREWPALRREMLRHAYHEVAETYLESGRHLRALQHAMPWYSGLSMRSARLALKSIAGALGVRRSLVPA